MHMPAETEWICFEK